MSVEYRDASPQCIAFSWDCVLCLRHNFRQLEHDFLAARAAEPDGLRKALRFYADDASWKADPNEPWAGGVPNAPVIADGGERARRALGVADRQETGE